MAHLINDVLNRIEGRRTVPCNDQCRHWKFPHLETACVLSDVFSVKKDVPCFEFEPKNEQEIRAGEVVLK